MPRLSKAQQIARQRIESAAALGLDPIRLSERILSALFSVIPVDGYRLFGIDPATLLVNRLLAASDSDAWARAEWLREVYLRSGDLGYIELPVLMHSGLTAVALHDRQETCWGYHPDLLSRIDPDRHHHLFHELRSPTGGTLLACFPVESRWVAALQAYRRDSDRPFRSGDVAFARSVAPVIGKAIAASLHREHAAIAHADTESASGIVIFGTDRKTTFVTPAGEALTKQITEPGNAGHGLGPTAIWSAIARLQTEGGAAASVVAQSSHGAVRVEASPAGPDGSIAIVLTPQRPVSPPETPPAWPLTGGERRVVNLALRGLTNAQISDHLFISVNTVEWHIRGAYEKLGVGSRATLLAKLFEETAAPGLF